MVSKGSVSNMNQKCQEDLNCIYTRYPLEGTVKCSDKVVDKT